MDVLHKPSAASRTDQFQRVPRELKELRSLGWNPVGCIPLRKESSQPERLRQGTAQQHTALRVLVSSVGAGGECATPGALAATGPQRGLPKEIEAPHQSVVLWDDLVPRLPVAGGAAPEAVLQVRHMPERLPCAQMRSVAGAVPREL